MYFWDRSLKNTNLKGSTQDLVNSMPPSPVKDGHALQAGGDLESLDASPRTAWRGDVTLGRRPDWQGKFTPNPSISVGALIETDSNPLCKANPHSSTCSHDKLMALFRNVWRVCRAIQRKERRSPGIRWIEDARGRRRPL